MTKVLSFLLLPKEISQFERQYLARVNGVALIFFLMHLPVLALVAFVNHTGPLLALVLTSAVVSGPVVAAHTLGNPRTISVVHGVCAMFMGGLLVHFGQGPMQIEMHFYFFALLAMCAVFGNPMVIVAAAVTVALHHLIVYLALPSSVFNYDASVWVVVVHAGFVVLESIATCFISRSFFDNVIGLEKIVQARTVALDSKNRDMRLLLDSIQQGLLTINRSGILANERSAVTDSWLGAPSRDGVSWFEYLRGSAPDFAARTELAWDEVRADIMPVALTLEQMPRTLKLGARTLSVSYRPIGDEPFESCLVIVTDVTSEVAREHVEIERQELMAVFGHLFSDRSGFESFLDEGGKIVDALTNENKQDDSLTRRLIHTLKGNASLFGLGTISAICHSLEDAIAQESRLPTHDDYAPLVERWSALAADVERFVGKRSRSIEIDDQEHEELLSAATSGNSLELVAQRLRDLKLEPTRKRLLHFAEQARRIADRLEKTDVQIRVEDNGVRLDAQEWSSYWSSFTHAIRNALDHGIELPAERVSNGKSPHGTIVLRTMKSQTQLTIEVSDDGRGVDWHAVRVRATAVGLSTSTTADVRAALFVDGVTTAASVTDISGRGVGMGALREATLALGGELTVKSNEGRGTSIVMSFPLQHDARSENVAA